MFVNHVGTTLTLPCIFNFLREFLANFVVGMVPTFIRLRQIFIMWSENMTENDRYTCFREEAYHWFV